MMSFEKPPKGAWRMVALACAAQNFAIGLSIGSFGVAVLAIEQEFHTTRALASLGASLVVAAHLLSPLVARLIERFSIRAVVGAGILLGSTGYVMLAFAPNIWVFLAVYLFLIGSGAVLAGNLPGSILVSNWFPTRKGRAIGVMMIPAGVMLVPLACTPILESIGLRALYLVLGGLNLLMLPLALMIRDRPPIEYRPRNIMGETRSEDVSARTLTYSQILKRPELWLLVVCAGLLYGSGMVKMSHLVALTAEQGRTLGEATMLLSLSGGAGVVGSLLFGWLADRIGGPAALVANGLIQAATWTIFLFSPGLPLLTLDAILMGVAGAGVFSAMAVSISQLFGSQNFARASGVMGFFVIVPNFLSPPIAGLIRDMSGSYGPVLHSVIGSCLVAAACMLFLVQRSKPRNAVVAC